MKQADDTETDGARLQRMFDALKSETGMKKAEFARVFKFPGGASMISQHISGHRPISLDAMVAYAKGFKCAVADISPTLAASLPTGPLYTEGSKQPIAPVNQAQKAIDIEASLHCLRMAALRIDDADRDALAGYVSKLIRDPERADLVPRALNILSPPAHKAMPETGAKRAA